MLDRSVAMEGPGMAPVRKLRMLPLRYVWRNLWVRRVTTGLTIGGMALVAYVFATVLMMSEGIRSALVSTGQPDNVIVLRRGAGAEINSGITREQAAVIGSLPGIAQGSGGQRLVSAEPVVLNTLRKRDSHKTANVAVRGTSAAIALALRPRVRLAAGRMFRPGTSEVVVGQVVANGFEGVEVGQTLHFSGRDWLVVGLFDAGRSGFDSEIWGDAEQMLQAYRRNTYSTVVFKLADPQHVDTMLSALESDPRLPMEGKTEQRFYAEQSELLTKFINYLGLFMSGIFSVGAIVGAMITMFAAVAQRTGEIGTLRALGFRRGAVLMTFMSESLALALAGGVIALAGASAMQQVSISTTNFQTLTELAFRFQLTWGIALWTLVFALFMGLIGGFVPAWNASRLDIVDCLRS